MEFMIKNNVYFIIVYKMYAKYIYVRIVDNKIMCVSMHTFFFSLWRAGY